MSIPRIYRNRIVAEGILDLMNADLATSLGLDSDEPTFYGNPVFVANYPCLVSVPHPSGLTMEYADSPSWGDFIQNHTIVYIFEGDRAHDLGYVDPWVAAEEYGSLIIDWLCYAHINNNIPLIDSDGEDEDTNWCFDMYEAPWTLRIANEYQNALSEVKTEYKLMAPSVEFRTKKRRMLYEPE